MAESDWKYLQYNIETGQKRTGDGPSGGASSLSDLDDTSISNPSDGQMLGYDETEGKWKNVSAPAGSVSDVQLDNQSVVDQNGVAKLTTPNIDALGKTAISNPADGEMLGYDGTEGKWKNVSAPGGNVDDVKVNGTSVVSNKVANITSYKEVTQAQYEALPDTKLSDNVLYAIKDGGQAVDGFPPLIYSDEEREVGVWRDGKPLYQKTFIKQLSGTATQIDISSINAETIFIYTGYYDMGITKLSLNEWMGNSVYTYTHINPTSQHYNIDCYCSIAQNTTIHITVQYTKTTDTPGSGTWTTKGALAHHYSTDEHIVGTWIDGKPLYEKVIEYGSLKSSAGEQSKTHGIADIDHVFIAEGEVFNSSGESKLLVNSSSSSEYQWTFSVDKTSIYSWVGRDRSAWSANLILRYTKTTD